MFLFCVDVANTKETKKETWQLKAAQELEKMLLVVVICYMVCWGPNQIIFFSYNMGAPVSFASTYYHISVVLAVMNSAINPFIYVLKNPFFRKGQWQKRHMHIVHTTQITEQY